MNKGFKNYTKRITQTVGNVAEVSVNVNRADRNIHITMPLVSTVGKCPFDTSLIFDYQSRATCFDFGKGTRLNFYSPISENNGDYEITNSDGSIDKYLGSKEYFNVETGLTLKHVYDAYELAYLYTVTDAQGNYIEFPIDSDYPKLIKKANGDKVSLDFISSIKTISNSYGDVINLIGSPNITYAKYYHNNELLASAEISYDANNYISGIIYRNNSNEIVKKLVLSISDELIIVKDDISGYRIRYSIPNVTIIDITDGYDDDFSRGGTTRITSVTGKTTITDDYGRESYILFDSDNYPIYEVDNNGKVVEYIFDKETNQIKFQSSPMNTKDVDDNLAEGVTPDIGSGSEKELRVVNKLDKMLVGDYVKSYWGTPTITYTIEEGGVETDCISAMVCGRFISSYRADTLVGVTLQLMSETNEIIDESPIVYISKPPSGDYDVAIIGICASSSFSSLRLKIDIPECDDMFELGGVRVVKRECGAFYNYDAEGNLVETVAGHKTKTAEYDSGKATNVLGVHSDSTNYEYNSKKQLVKSSHAYGANVKYEYDAIHSNNVSKAIVTDGTGTVRLETSKTYTNDGRFVETETDANGLTKRYSYEDACGNLSSVRDSMSVITNYEYFDEGLLRALKLTDANNNSNSSSATYTYDSKRRIKTVTLDNGSVYTFEYDDYDNISSIKLNGVVVFRYEYDDKNRLVKQFYGESSDCYEFTYNNNGMIYDIFYVKNGSRDLKYTYIYDTINRLVSVENAENDTCVDYEYDADGRVVKVIAPSSTVETEYDNLGDVTIKRSNVNGKKIYQSFDSVNRSKGSHPSIVLKRDVLSINNAYIATFYDDAAVRNYSGEEICPTNHDGTKSYISASLDGVIPCCKIDSTRLLSYSLPMERYNTQECGFISFCFKPSALYRQHLFSAKSADDKSSLNVYMDASGTVYVKMTDMLGTLYNIVTCTNKVIANEWNYFAISFMLREGFSGGGRTQIYVNLNGNIDSYNYSNLINFYLGVPAVYNIGHKYDGTAVSECFDGLISCVTFTPRDDIGTTSMNEHYKHIKDYVISNTLINSLDGTVDFSDTSLYTTDATVPDSFEIYPLHNSIKSLNGKMPTHFENRSVGKIDKDRSFAFNTPIKRYAYVAEGYDLMYELDSLISGTVMMRAYITTPDNRQYFFDTKDSAGRTLGLFRDSEKEVCIDYNGEKISTQFVIEDKTWKTVGLSFSTSITGDSDAPTKCFNMRVYVDGETYNITKDVTDEYKADFLSVGKSYTSDATPGFAERAKNFGPLQGQIEMVAVGSSFCETEMIETLDTELKTYTKVCGFDELGMLKKTELHLGGTPILSDEITYKKNGVNTTPCVEKETFNCNGDTITREYTTDLYGRVTAVSDSVLGNHTYEYDYRGFLVKEDGRTFAYDGNGNITRCGDTVFTYDSVIKDRLMSVGGRSITYSESNPLNPKTYDGKTFEFEGRRLVKVTSDAMVATYKYDASGLRTEKAVTKNGVTTITKFVYDSGKLIAEYTDSDRVDYLYDENGMLYGFIYDNAKYFYIRDTLQNILGIVDANGTAVVHYNYSAYGECKAITGSKKDTIGVINSFRYKGYYFDEETGFFYCKLRYYLPQWMRWLNCDNPAELSTDSINANLQIYCENNPIMNIDASGFKAEWLGWVLGGVAVVAAVALTVCSMGTLTGVAIGAALATGAIAGGIGGALSAASTGGDIGQGIVTGMLVGAAGAINPVAGGLMAAGMSLINDRINEEEFNMKSVVKSVVSGTTACAFAYASAGLAKSMMPTSCDVLTEWVANGLSNFIFSTHNFVVDTIIAKFVNW